MKKRGLLQHADGSDFFGFHITSTVPRLGEMVDSILSLISGEVRGGEGKGEVNCCCLVRDEPAFENMTNCRIMMNWFNFWGEEKEILFTFAWTVESLFLAL